MKIEVKQVSLGATANTGKSEQGVRVDRATASSERWGLYVNGIMIGDSKARFDADHAKLMLEKALLGWVVPAHVLRYMVEQSAAEILRLKNAVAPVPDIDAYIELTHRAGEDFQGERREAQRRFIVEAAVSAADRIILRYTDGSVEELEFFTAQVANEFFSKVVQGTQLALLRKELLRNPK